MSTISENSLGDESGSGRKQAWRRSSLFFALATGLLFALHFETVAAMVKIWTVSDTFGYGFLILPLVLFLVIQRRQQLALLTPRPFYWALIWIAGALLLTLIGTIASLSLFNQLGFVALWQGLFALFMGWSVVRRLLFPLFYLFFAVPMGAEIVPLLQTITAEITVPLLRASGIPTFHEGVFIQTPTGSFVVAEICSGARFLITSVVLGALAAHLFFLSWFRRSIFMLLCVVVPILANGLRAYGIIVLAHFSDSGTALAFDHIIYGLIFLSLVLVTLIGLGALFRDRWPQQETLAAPPPETIVRRSASLGALFLAIVFLAGGSAWTSQVTAEPSVTGPVELAAPLLTGNWHLSVDYPSGWEPAFPGADAQLLQAYQADEGEVAIFLAHYRYQRDGHEIISNVNSVAGKDPDNQVIRFERIDVTAADLLYTLHETTVQTPLGSRLIWSWYEIGGTPIVSPVRGKFLEIWYTLSGGSRSATAFALSTMVEDDPRRARAALKAFLSAMEANRSHGGHAAAIQ